MTKTSDELAVKYTKLVNLNLRDGDGKSLAGEPKNWAKEVENREVEQMSGKVNISYTKRKNAEKLCVAA